MGLRISVLAILAFIVWAASSVTYPVNSGCIECHKPHNEIQGTCTDCHQGNPRTNRIRIAHYRLIDSEYAHFNFPQSPAVVSGRMLIEKFACRRCHRTGGRGNQLAADLDRALHTVQPRSLSAAIKEPVPFMPDFYFTESQNSELVNAVLAAGGAEPHDNEIPVVVHFESKSESRLNIFDKNCGACHRVLTRRLGGLGWGNIGPNLSGLLTRFYPQNYTGDTFWSRSGLKKWLENPRSIRTSTQMPPVQLGHDDFVHLTDILTS